MGIKILLADTTKTKNALQRNVRPIQVEHCPCLDMIKASVDKHTKLYYRMHAFDRKSFPSATQLVCFVRRSRDQWNADDRVSARTRKCP